jgi:hypothetical protein
MSSQSITIIIHSDIDPSTLLEIAQQYGQQIADEVESHDPWRQTYRNDAVFHEEEVSVEYCDDDTILVGGE